MNALAVRQDNIIIDAKVLEKNILNKLLAESLKTAIFNEDTCANKRNYKCSIDGCDRKGYAKGLCNAHYLRHRKNLDMNLPIKNRQQGTHCVECNKPITKHGGWHRCANHYKQKRLAIIKNVLIESLGGKCNRCKNVYASNVYDFHHLGQKDYAIGEIMNSSSIKIIAKEISKCELVRANCHREIHNAKI